jgi:[histone H3]-lysine36 N-dimethyltransferase SETMAR
MSDQFIDKIYIRHCLRYEFKVGSNATQASNRINSAYGQVISVRQAQEWFARFRSGDLSLEDKPRPGRPSGIDNDVLKSIIEEDPRLTTHQIADILRVGQTTVYEHLVAIGKEYKVGKWVPHSLTIEQKSVRVDICMSLLSRHDNCPFWKNVLTSDEKWVYYENPVRHGEWRSPGQAPGTTPRRDLWARKAMLCIWWDYQGVVYYEVLNYGQILDADLYCQQLDRLREVLAIKRPSLVNRNRLIYQRDNARPHSAKKTQQKIKTFSGWEVLPHPPYSPDIAPSDYHLFRPLQTFLNNKTFNDIIGIRSEIDKFIDITPQLFYEEGIKKLANKWQDVIDNDGDYIID